MRVNLILIGPPGSGKGTQAARLAKRYRIPHVSTGDILRQAVREGSPLGRDVAATLASGGLVSDTLMASLVRERLAAPDTERGFILDGFPRTISQAHALDEILTREPPTVVLISVPDEEIVRRLSSRRLCSSCRITQSVSDESDPQSETCPYCGGTLARRDDDEAETVRRRLVTYASVADPVIALYEARPHFVAVDGLQEPDAVTGVLFTAIDRIVHGV